MPEDPRKLKLRIEVLDTDDVKFIQSMLAARIKEAEANKKLDPQERDMLVSRYRMLFQQFGRRFPKSSGRDNPLVQFRHSVPGHVLLVDERVAGQSIENIAAIPSSVALDRMIADCKLVGVLGEFEGVRTLKDRSGLNTEPAE